jgi:molecular chaperone DnaK (HSP70)
LENLFGRDVWSEFIKQNPEDLLAIKRTFEAKKRALTAQPTEATIPYPPSLFTTYHVKRKVKSVKEGFEKSRYSHTIKVVKNKLRFDPKIMKQFFKQTTDSIIAHVKDILVQNKRQKGVIGTILMVGGFSDSPLIYERVKSEFPKLNVICPSDAVAAVLKGAVMYGHNPELISERKCPRTYGITVNEPFDDRKHPYKLKTFSNGRYVCTDVFKVIVRLGEPLIVGKSNFEVSCAPNQEFDSEANVEVYESSNENPMYTIDKDVKLLGMLTVPMPDINGGKHRRIQTNIHFGYTELYVTASEEGTNRKAEAKFNCLLK